MEVDGAPRDLNPVVREEAYRIAGEALRNAVKHARARRITVTIHYEARQLRLTVCDDGIGMGEETRQHQHTAGHFGLRGMRERAAIVGGRLEVCSRSAAGRRLNCACRRRSRTVGRPVRGGRESSRCSRPRSVAANPAGKDEESGSETKRCDGRLHAPRVPG